MRTILLSHRNRADSAALSGGSWEAGQPLANLQNRFLFRSARSTDAAPASTVLDCDFGTETVIRVVCLLGHNLSLAGQVRMQLRTAAAGGGELIAGHESFVDAWSAMFAGQPARKPTAEEAEDLPAIVPLVLDQDYAARWLRVEISDAANASGCVELSRLWAGPGWQPEHNFAYGAEFGLEDETQINESPAGAVFTGHSKKRRTMRLSLDWLGVDEGFQQARDMTQRLGKTGQLLVSASPEESDLNRPRMTMLATMEPASLVLPRHGLSTMRLDLREVIA